MERKKINNGTMWSAKFSHIQSTLHKIHGYFLECQALFKENDVCMPVSSTIQLVDSVYQKMEYSDPTVTGTNIASSSRPAASHPTVQGPCAACKFLRRRCTDRCALAPYFPPSEPLNFIIAHKVFGASNVIKLLQVIIPASRLLLIIYIYIFFFFL